MDALDLLKLLGFFAVIIPLGIWIQRRNFEMAIAIVAEKHGVKAEDLAAALSQKPASKTAGKS